jgi:hypothetical protein
MKFPSLLETTLIALLFAGSVSAPAIGQTNQPQPKSDKDKCLTDKDHDACRRYYRGACIAKDGEACKSYAKELKASCGPEPGPQTPPAKLSEYLGCARKAQCWENRSIGLLQMNEVCKADANSAACTEMKNRFAQFTPQACDQIGGGVF